MITLRHDSLTTDESKSTCEAQKRDIERTLRDKNISLKNQQKVSANQTRHSLTHNLSFIANLNLMAVKMVKSEKSQQKFNCIKRKLMALIVIVKNRRNKCS